MSTPGIVPGGPTLYTSSSALSSVAQNELIEDLQAFEAEGVFSSPYPVGSKGQFAQFPGATPKYALNRGLRDNEFRETLARMFVPMTEQERTLFVESVPLESQPLAKVLCGAGSGASGGTGFIDFLLTNVVEAFQEKIQVVETLSDNFIVYAFGQQAPTFSYSGVVYNTYQDDQRVWLMRLYRDILRGTQLARRRKLVRLRYDSVIVSGIFVSLQETLTGDAVDHASFSLSMIPTQYVIFSPALGQPTQLRTAFTEGSAYGLTSTQPENTALQEVAQVGQSGDRLKRTNEKTDVPYPQKTPKTLPLSALYSRLDVPGFPVNISNVR